MQHERCNKGESAVYLPSEHAVVLEPFHCWVNVTQPINRALWMQRRLLWEDAQQIIRTTALQSVVNCFQVTVVTARTSLGSRLCQSLRSLVPAFHLRLLTNKTNRASPPLNAPTSGPSNLVRTHSVWHWTDNSNMSNDTAIGHCGQTCVSRHNINTTKCFHLNFNLMLMLKDALRDFKQL